MLAQLFVTQKQYIDYFFHNLDVEEAETLLQALLSCSGIVLCSGVGKSGIIAQKVSSTLVSVGTKALYLPPTDALHGTLGIVGPQDLCLLFSKSGESEELLQLASFAKERGALLAGILCNKQSRLARLCDLTVTLPLERELCPFDLAPTTSTAIQLLFGDILTVGLMRSKNLSLDSYAHNHPAGRIGKRARTKIHELMLKDGALPLCRKEDLLVDVLAELSGKQCGCLLATDSGKHLLGIFTDGDLRRGLQAKGTALLQNKIEELMTKNPKTITPNQLASDAMRMMEKGSPIMALPVIEEGQVVGLIKMHDLIREGL